MVNPNSGRGKVDSAQVLPYIYDTAEDAIRVVPVAGSFSISLNANEDSIESRHSTIDTTTLFENIFAAENYNSDAVDILRYKGYALMFVWSGLNGFDGNVKLMASVDGKHWDWTGRGRALNISEGTHLFEEKDVQYKYFRLSYSNRDNTTGTISAQYVIKG